VTLSWIASTSPSIVGYNIYRGTQKGGPYPTKLTETPQTGTSFVDDTVQSGTTYFYVATAVNSNSESTYSNEVMAKIL
jgi:fibronectin type 3 domain-containing protein